MNLVLYPKNVSILRKLLLFFYRLYSSVYGVFFSDDYSQYNTLGVNKYEIKFFFLETRF